MKIICIGRNYTAHAAEMKSSIPDAPVFFMKPSTALLKDLALTYPPFTRELHYETEIVYRICKLVKDVDAKTAGKTYDAVALGFDFTARDIQRACKEKSLPWEKAKAFDGSAATGDFIDTASINGGNSIAFHLELNGKIVQKGHSDDMIFPVDTLIAHVSEYITLEPGDLLFTGTPSGVGEVQRGDRLIAYLNGKKNLEVAVE